MPKVDSVTQPAGVTAEGSSVETPAKQSVKDASFEVEITTTPAEGSPVDPPADKEEEVKEKPKPVVRNKVRTTDPADGVDLAMGTEGMEADEPLTIGQAFKNTVWDYGDSPALSYKEGDEWKHITYTEYYDLCVATAKSFVKLGLEDFHGVGIIGFNSKEWLISNVGAIFAGGLAFGIYATNNADACQYVAHDCKANILVVENQKQLDKIFQVRDQLPHLKAIVQYTGKLSQEYENTYDWEQFMELGKDIGTSVIEEKIAAQKPGQCATLVYTSGTTGQPKGVMLSHDNMTWTPRAFHTSCVPAIGFKSDRIISYLPLSHIAAQVFDIILPMYCGATVYFAQPDALKGSLLTTLKEVRPTVLFGVPRTWEKIQAAMQCLSPRVPVHSLKEEIGLGSLGVAITGAAPIHQQVLQYFNSVGVSLLELFGMSELTGPGTFNLIGRWRMGSVGQPMEGTKVRIANPNQKGEGEVIVYGRHVFMGYLNNEEKTKETIDDEGWLHSGDIGKIDEDGFLFITGRIKELIITSGGENMAPVPVEDRIKEAIPFLSNVVMIGDKRKFVSCLVTLKCVMNPDSGEPTDDLDPVALQQMAALGSKCTKVSEVIEQKDESVFGAIQKGLDRANEKAISHAQKVQKFSILTKDLSRAGGELGPTLKLKRQVVMNKYGELINEMYSTGTRAS